LPLQNLLKNIILQYVKIEKKLSCTYISQHLLFSFFFCILINIDKYLNKCCLSKRLKNHTEPLLSIGSLTCQKTEALIASANYLNQNQCHLQ